MPIEVDRTTTTSDSASSKHLKVSLSADLSVSSRKQFLSDDGDERTHRASESFDTLRTSNDGSHRFAPDPNSLLITNHSGKTKEREHKSIRELTINKLNYQAIGLASRYTSNAPRSSC